MKRNKNLYHKNIRLVIIIIVIIMFVWWTCVGWTLSVIRGLIMELRALKIENTSTFTVWWA
jgi:hypothetical protein